MRQTRLIFSGPRGAAGLWAPAILLGISAAVFVHSYWLSDWLPAQSRQLLVLAVAVAFAMAIGYLFILRWLHEAIRGLDLKRGILFAAGSALLCAFVFFGGTSEWLKPGKYLVFLLPQHRLTFSVKAPAGAGTEAVTWFNTSLGDVSYDALKMNGWTRKGEALVVSRTGDNSVSWSGATGSRAELVIEASGPGATLVSEWDGRQQTLVLQKGKNVYDHDFTVPFYASGGMVVALGVLNFLILSAGLLLAVRARWLEWHGTMLASIRPAPGRLQSSDLLGLGALVALALALRVFNLGSVFPAVDEYYHLIAARQLVQGAALGSVYERGLWLVTIPISLAFRVFGYQLWAARLTGVIFNTLAVIPLYLVARRINRAVATLSCVVYAISPWIITFGRVAREYAFYPFYFYWIVYLMVLFVAWIPAGFVVRRDWRSIVRPRFLLLAAALAFPPYFALVVDWLSTFRTILIAYVVLGAALLVQFNWSAKSNWPVLGVLAAALGLGARAAYGEQASKLLALPRLNPVPIEYFLPNPQQQWYFDRLVIIVPLALVAAGVYAWSVRRSSIVPLFFLSLFAAYLAVFALFSRSFFHTRHLLTTELWFTVLCGMGLFALWGAFRGVVPLGGNVGKFVGVAVLAVGMTNVSQVLLPTVSTNPDMPISEDYLHDMSQVQAFMLKQARPEDVLISTVYGLYATWQDAPKFRSQYRITSATPLEDVLGIAAQNPSGWIVIDKIRLDLSDLSNRNLTRSQQIEYVGTFGDEYVWRWRRSTGWAEARRGTN